ncbi:hypothetical protein C5167_037556 [Papaver somniferum]|uniref:J domain-containing protein n=1 Tax=Papaver somniferum TaxID=3469 RepID=A0A4Y7IB05_PAPSO|nr:auxilin-like protein 1 [Papaver somniferum]RZC44605.1 hypothetical protein C5167_037556 [Papaver somniferum]
MADFAVKKSSAKKVSNKGNGNGYTGGGGGGGSKTVYDDVFGGPPKFGVPSIGSSGMIDDYSEIFGGFNSTRVSSIPILDLPVVDEKDVSIDVRSSKFDYSEVFGGFNGLDFAVSYEELLAAESKGGGGESSSDDAWTSAETGSPSEGSNEDPACSETNQTFSNEESYESDGVKQFNVSYQKSNQISRDGEITATTHIAQLNSVPAFTFLVDESIPSQNAEDNTLDQVTKFHSLDLDFGDHVNEENDLEETISDQSVYHGIAQISKHQTNHLKETISYEPFFPAVRELSESDSVHQRNHHKETTSFQPISHAVRQISEGDSIHPKNHLKDTSLGQSVTVTRIPERALEPHGKPGGNGTHPSKGYLTVSEINLKTNPCHVTHIPERALEPPAKPGGNGTHPSKGFVTVSEINLRTNPCHVPPPSRPPPKVSIWRGDSKIYTASHPRASYNSVLQRAVSDSSAQFFDVEVDASSSAEASAAAMKEAMDFAQARLKSAKELMERKKDGLQNRKKLGFKDESKSMKKRELEAAPQAQFSNEKPNDIPEHADKEIKGINVEDRASRVVEVDEDSGVTGKKIVNASEEMAEQNYRQDTGSMQASHGEEEDGEWKVEEQYYELVQTVIHRAVMETSKHESVEDMKSTRRESEVAHDENTKAALELNMRGEYEKELDVAQEVCNHERNDNHCNVELEKEDDEKKLKEPSNESVSKLEQTHVQEEIEQFQEEERKREEFEEREKMARERQEHEKRLEEARKQEENERRQIEENEREESKKRLKESREREEEDAKLLKEAQELEEKRREEAHEHERRLKEELEREENEKKLKEAHEREVNEKRLKETREKEDNERRVREALEKEENERRLREALEREENERRLRESLEREENERRLRESIEREENERRLREALEREETERRLREEEEEFEKRQTETREREEQERKVKEAREQEENLRRQQELKREENEKNAKAAQEALVHSKGEENLKASAGCLENADSGNTKKAAEEACRQDEDKVLAQMSSEPDLEKIREADRGTKLQDGEKNFAEVQTVVSQEKIGRSKKMSQGALEQEENNCAAQRKKQLVENGRKLEAAHPTNVMDANGLNASKNIEKKNKAESLSLEEREKEKRMQRERDREVERLRKVEEDREREREREKDRMAVERATREARERALADARERAERAAVERATAEARQRAVAEARERLDRASAVAREKSVAEKSFTEGKIRAERDARLRLERAAVERATAEARERAAEKLKSDKAAFGARDRTERTYSEKYSSTSRDSGIRHSSSFSDLRDTQHQSSGASNSFQRNSNSSNHASNVSERYQGAEIESAQRCKARLERHQRTVERAAKALAEKNMRDLLAQREQAERNRFSDTLDAEVRRWSNGKEGNLRALLSTLQYILGPDSGWHPVPLTEVITAVAVKKAYRKATLCVHPDKLQQRGATIQQKYICEKVFDLLKEAWNKFNSEER